MNRSQKETVAAFLANVNGGPVDVFIEQFVVKQIDWALEEAAALCSRSRSRDWSRFECANQIRAQLIRDRRFSRQEDHDAS